MKPIHVTIGLASLLVWLMLPTSFVCSESPKASDRLALGTAFGMDAMSAGKLSGYVLEAGAGAYFQFPTLEIRKPLASGHALDFQIPIGDFTFALLTTTAASLPSLPLGLGIHYTFFFPTRSFRWFVGPGAWLNAGIKLAGPLSLALGIQPGVQLGIEWRSGDVGVMLRLRPYATIGAAIAQGGASEVLGVGGSFELVVLHYR